MVQQSTHCSDPQSRRSEGCALVDRESERLVESQISCLGWVTSFRWSHLLSFRKWASRRNVTRTSHTANTMKTAMLSPAPFTAVTREPEDIESSSLGWKPVTGFQQRWKWTYRTEVLMGGGGETWSTWAAVPWIWSLESYSLRAESSHCAEKWHLAACRASQRSQSQLPGQLSSKLFWKKIPNQRS